MPARLPSFAPLMVAAILLVGCGSGGQPGSNEAAVGSGETLPTAATTKVPDACTFIPKSELEGLVGRELRDGDRNDMPAGFSQCDFETQPQSATTRTFEHPPLPEAAGFSSVTITTHPTTPGTFAQSRQAIGNSAESVSRIGDEAYFEGPAVIHVRAGDRGLGMRLHVSEPKTEAGRQTLRAVMLSLAKAGAERLR